AAQGGSVKQGAAYEGCTCLEFRRVLFRSVGLVDVQGGGPGDLGGGDVEELVAAAGVGGGRADEAVAGVGVVVQVDGPVLEADLRSEERRVGDGGSSPVARDV